MQSFSWVLSINPNPQVEVPKLCLVYRMMHGWGLDEQYDVKNVCEIRQFLYLICVIPICPGNSAIQYHAGRTASEVEVNFNEAVSLEAAGVALLLQAHGNWTTEMNCTYSQGKQLCFNKDSLTAGPRWKCYYLSNSFCLVWSSGWR